MMSRITNAADVMHQVDRERSAEYAKDLGPQLEAWRTKVQQRSPSIPSRMTYLKTDSFIGAGQICTDMNSLANEYRAKVIVDTHQNAASK